MTWQNQQNECVPSEDSDQPGHMPSLIRVFTYTQWVANDSSFLHADSEDSDQTGRMPRLIWVFAGCTAIVGFVMLRLKSRIVNKTVIKLLETPVVSMSKSSEKQIWWVADDSLGIIFHVSL